MTFKKVEHMTCDVILHYCINIVAVAILKLDKLTELIEQTFNGEGSLYLACNDKNAFFFTSENIRCSPLSLDNIFLRFCSQLHKQIVGIPMGTNQARLVADLFLFCFVIAALWSPAGKGLTS